MGDATQVPNFYVTNNIKDNIADHRVESPLISRPTPNFAQITYWYQYIPWHEMYNF